MSGSVLESAVNDRSTEASLAHRLFLSGFVLDLAAGELLTPDRQLAGVRKQALEVLLLLGARAGQVVGKDELMRAVWPDVVVGEGSLAKAISDIRHVLHDHDHRLIRDVARRGYMLVPDPAPLDQSPAVPAATDSNFALGQTRALRRAPLTALTVLLVGIVALIAVAAWLNNERQRNPAALSASPLGSQVPSVSLVVLPLKAESGTAEDWFADAITTDLTTSMGRMSGSFVIGRSTAFTYKGKEVDPRNVARELGVRYVVLGSTRRGRRARAAELVDGGWRIRSRALEPAVQY